MLKKITLVLFLFILTIQPSYADSIGIGYLSSGITTPLSFLLLIAISILGISGLSLMVLNFIKLARDKKNIKIDNKNSIKETIPKRTKSLLIILVVISFIVFYYAGPFIPQILFTTSSIIMAVSAFLLLALYSIKHFKKTPKESMIEEVSQQKENE